MSGAGYAYGILLTLVFYLLFILPMNRSYRKQKLALMRKTIRKRIAYKLINSSQELLELDPGELKSAYPIEGDVEGWYFKQTKINDNEIELEGCDLFGRKLAQKGTNQKELLEELSEQAKEVNRQLAAHNKLNPSGTSQSDAPV